MNARPQPDDRTAQAITAELLTTADGRARALLATLADLRAAELSFIPVRGEHAATYDDAKRPAIETLSPWQYDRRPTAQEIQAWLDSGACAWGIFTGEVNRLICLDFDADTTLRTFLDAMPAELTSTYTEKTPRGLHLWYRLPPDVPAPHTMFIDGGELRGEGVYTLIAPMTWHGQTWRAVHGDLTTIRTLSPAEYAAVLAWYETRQTDTTDADELHGAPMTADDMKRMYGALRCSRNQALFRTAYIAHCRGNTADQVERALVSVYTSEKKPRTDYSKETHRHDTDAQRQREARDTIASAFNQKRRATDTAAYAGALSNVLRESLLQRKRVQFGQQFARFYEAMISAGYAPGQPFCAACAVKAVKGVMSRGVVLKALKCGFVRAAAQPGAASPDGDLRSPLSLENGDSGNYDPFCHSYTAGNAEGINKCLCTVTKRIIIDNASHAGRKTSTVYTLPTLTELCQRLGVEDVPFAGDTLAAGALRSAATYRRALHTARIHGRPGRYSARMLARRLDVTRRTVYRYNHDERVGVHTAPQFKDYELTQANITAAIADDDTEHIHAGMWLEDGSGRKYAPRRGVARAILAQGERVWLVSRHWNYYATDPALLPDVKPTAAERQNADAMTPGRPQTSAAPAVKAITHDAPPAADNADQPFAEILAAGPRADGVRVVIGARREVVQ